VYDPVPEPAPLSVVAPARPVLPVQRVGALVEIVLCSGFPSQLLLIMVLSGFGMSARTADGRLSPPFVFTLSLLDAVIVIGLVLFFLRAHHESAREVLFRHRSTWREILVGIVMIPAVFIFVILVLGVILTVAPQLHNVPRNPLEDMLLNRGDAMIFAVVVMVSGGVREEVQRGFVLHRFGQYLGGAGYGVVIYSMLFGLGHIEQGFDAAIATALLGALWGVLYLARRSILAPMVSHAGFNLAQLVKYFGMASP
jgi:membrane protease YdiL (CAAX protease family)